MDAIDLEKLDDRERDLLLSRLLERDGVLADDDTEQPPRRRSSRPSAPAPAPPVKPVAPVKPAEPTDTVEPPAKPVAKTVTGDTDIVDYKVPDSVIDDLAAAYQVTDHKQLASAATWTANQFRELYTGNQSHRQIFWGALERAALRTLIHNKAIRGNARRRAEQDLGEFEEFLDSLASNERGAVLDLPSLASEITSPQADRNFKSVCRLLATRLGRVRSTHLDVYADFLRIARLFAVLTRKEAEYRTRGVPEDQIRRKIAATRKVIYGRVADVDSYTVLVYVEVLRNALAAASKEARAAAHERVTEALRIVRAAIAERHSIARQTFEEAVATDDAK